MLSKVKRYWPQAGLILLTLITRFIKLDWGDGYFFHPDENNMARSISQMKPDLNPHFFAYGQFPLYLAYFTIKYLKLPQSFDTSIYVLRFYSALFACLSLFVFYQISRFFFTRKHSQIFSLLLIFSPGLIQISKFGTTESLLILVFSLNIYLSVKYYQTQNSLFIHLASLVSGIGLASKISSLAFFAPIFLSICFSSKKLISLLNRSFLFVLLTFLFFVLFSPHTLISWPNFVSTSAYETSVANGRLKVFYTRQFENTPAYIFQLIKIFPYVSGLPVFLIFFISLFHKTPRQFTSKKIEFLIVLIPVVVYFIYFGGIYAKWTRFVSPVFFIFPFVGFFYLVNLKSKTIRAILIFLSILPGFFFLSIYFNKDIRIQASSWINQNVDNSHTIFSEAGNVVDIPINSLIHTINFDFYSLDESPSLQAQLPDLLSQVDYILVPSRRIFKNQNNPDFPYSQRYYQLLFSNQLGFTHIKTFSVLPSLLNHENAEETFTVFDHPTIRLYQKTQLINPVDLKILLTP